MSLSLYKQRRDGPYERERGEEEDLLFFIFFRLSLPMQVLPPPLPLLCVPNNLALGKIVDIEG